MKATILYVIDFLRSFYFMRLSSYPYSKAWDYELNLLMQTNDFTKIESHTAMLGNRVIWIANYPFACFHEYGTNVKQFTPSKITVLRAKRKLEADRKKSPEEIKKRQEVALYENKLRRDAHILALLKDVQNKKTDVKDAAFTIIAYKEMEATK